MRIALLALLLLLIAGAIYALNQPLLRIVHVEVTGRDPVLIAYAENALAGTYLGLVPRDSAIFIPKRAIRGPTLSEHPEISAVSVTRRSLHTLVVKVTPRTAVARWCGSGESDSPLQCFYFDPNGYLFVDAALASSTKPVHTFALYAPLAREGDAPLKNTLRHAAELPTTFLFARRLGAMEAPVREVVIEGDEASHFLKSGARVTYALGSEMDAINALVSADVDLSDPALEYVDLRFGGKVYVKRR